MVKWAFDCPVMCSGMTHVGATRSFPVGASKGSLPSSAKWTSTSIITTGVFFLPASGKTAVTTRFMGNQVIGRTRRASSTSFFVESTSDTMKHN